MRSISLNSYLIDEDGNYVLDEGGDKIILSTGEYEYDESYTRVGTGLGPRVPGIHSFDVVYGLSTGGLEEWYLRVNQTVLIGRYASRAQALGVLIGLFRRNSASGSDAALSKIISYRLSTGSVISDLTALPDPSFNSYAFLPDITYYDDIYGLSDGTSSGQFQDETFNPEPTSGYTGRTDLLAMGAAAIDNTSNVYFTVFDSERLFSGETDWYYTDGNGYLRINPTHVVARITNALADGYYYGRTDLRGAWMQIDLEHGPFITVTEEAGTYWNHPEFDQGPWTALRQDIIDTVAAVKEAFDCYVTWYAVPRIGNFLQYSRDTVAPFTNNRPAKSTFSDFTNSGFYSDIIPETPTPGGWQEDLKDKIQLAWNDAFGPVLDVLDGYHLRYYVNRSLNDTEYAAAGSSRSNAQQWIQQLHNLQFCKDYNTANSLTTPILPTTAAYTVGGGSAIGDYGVSLLTLPNAAGETTSSTQVWINDVQTSNYTVTTVGDDAFVAISEAINPTDAVRCNWHYGSSNSQSSQFDDPLSLETLYDNRLASIDSFDAKVTDRFVAEQPDGCMWWTSGIGLFVAWSLDPTRTSWDGGETTQFSDSRKDAIADWRYWIDLNYATGGYLFDGDVNAQTAKGFWNNDLINEPGLRDKWIKTFTTYVNSHYAAPLAAAPGLGSIPSRLWSTYDFDGATWDATLLPVQDVFFSGSASVTDFGSLWQISFTIDAGLHAQPDGITLSANRNRTKLEVTLADGTPCIAASASEAGGVLSFFVLKPNGSGGGDVLTGASANLTDFYPVAKPPNALHSSVALV